MKKIELLFDEIRDERVDVEMVETGWADDLESDVSEAIYRYCRQAGRPPGSDRLLVAQQGAVIAIMAVLHPKSVAELDGQTE